MEEQIKKLEKTVFNTLYDIDTRERAVEKNTGKNVLNYLPWATTYSEVCKHFSDVQYSFLRQTIEVEETTETKVDENTTKTKRVHYIKELPYFNTELGLEVRTSVTINGVKKEMCLPVYDASYKSMGLEDYSYETKYGKKDCKAAKYDDVYRSIMRCFAKNLSMFGIGLNFWTKEEAPDTVLQMNKLQAECMELISKKNALSKEAGEKVASLCKELIPDVNGDPRLCEDNDILETLKKRLLGIRK